MKQYLHNCLFIVLLAATPLTAQDGKALERLDKELSRIAKQSGLPGFAVAVVKDETAVFVKGYGFADRKSKMPFDGQTILPVGSVSKTFIGLALVKAMELGYFSLDTPINDLLPFPVINPHFPEAVITVRHLATHTSGILDNDSIYAKTYQQRPKPDMPLGQFLRAYLRSGDSLFLTTHFDPVLPGRRFHYSNIASALAAYLIEARAGISFDAFTRKYLFEPLGLSGTHWFYDETRSGHYATLYEDQRPEALLAAGFLNPDNSLNTYTSITYPDGSLKSSAADLSRYLAEMIKAYHGKSALIRPEYYRLLFQKQFDDANMPENMLLTEPQRALFWAYNRKGRLTHTGSDPGVFAGLSIDLDKRIGRVILINTSIEGADNTATLEALQKIIRALDNLE